MSELLGSLVAHILELICVYICGYGCDSSSVTSGKNDTLRFLRTGCCQRKRQEDGENYMDGSSVICVLRGIFLY